MANEGHIIVKKSKHGYGMKQFFRPVDKGSAKPAFCYPRRAEGLREELRTMERNLEQGNVDPERKMAYEQKAEQIRKRVSEIDASFENAKSIIDKDPDKWLKRRDVLAEEIADRMPTKDDVRKRRVNPHRVLREEKEGTRGSQPLEQLKREYTIISKAFQARGDFEDSNSSFLQKD
jgi:hypothetical protein